MTKIHDGVWAEGSPGEHMVSMRSSVHGRSNTPLLQPHEAASAVFQPPAARSGTTSPIDIADWVAAVGLHLEPNEFVRGGFSWLNITLGLRVHLRYE